MKKLTECEWTIERCRIGNGWTVCTLTWCGTLPTFFFNRRRSALDFCKRNGFRVQIGGPDEGKGGGR